MTNHFLLSSGKRKEKKNNERKDEHYKNHDEENQKGQPPILEKIKQNKHPFYLLPFFFIFVRSSERIKNQTKKKN